MKKQSVPGSCFCGKVTYQITGNLGIFQYCHCSRCRKFTGSAFASNIIVLPEHFEWLTGIEHIASYEPEGPKYFATTFCKNCGSSLPWMVKTGKSIVVPAGTLDGDPEIRPMQNIYCASKAVWYLEPEVLPKYEELPPRS